jgi:hypothetical protein
VQLSKHTQDNIAAIDKALEVELSKSLNSLVGALSALSSKFVSDYTPLTEKLRDVLTIAENGHVQSR